MCKTTLSADMVCPFDANKPCATAAMRAIQPVGSASGWARRRPRDHLLIIRPQSGATATTTSNGAWQTGS